MGAHNDRICQLIIAEMKKQGMTRKDMAKALDLTYNQMCNILNDRCSLSVDRLYKISDILDIPVSSFI